MEHGIVPGALARVRPAGPNKGPDLRAKTHFGIGATTVC